MQLCNMAKLRKRKWNSQHCATLWQGNLHKVAAPHLPLFIYKVQLYKEDWTILHMLGCQAIALPSTKEIVSAQATQKWHKQRCFTSLCIYSHRVNCSGSTRRWRTMDPWDNYWEGRPQSPQPAHITYRLQQWGEELHVIDNISGQCQ